MSGRRACPQWTLRRRARNRARARSGGDSPSLRPRMCVKGSLTCACACRHACGWGNGLAPSARSGKGLCGTVIEGGATPRDGPGARQGIAVRRVRGCRMCRIRYAKGVLGPGGEGGHGGGRGRGHTVGQGRTEHGDVVLCAPVHDARGVVDLCRRWASSKGQGCTGRVKGR